MAQDRYQLVALSLQDEDNYLPSRPQEPARLPSYAPFNASSQQHLVASGDISQQYETYGQWSGRHPSRKVFEESISVLPSTRPTRPWKTGYFRNVPWIGIGSLVLVLCSAIASAGVLVLSDQAAVASWKVAPSVILAILSAVSSACLRLALDHGLNISWWHRMLNGASLADAHRYWEYGTSLWPAITAGRHFNVLSAASILVALAALEGPLLQRASPRPLTRQVQKDVMLQAALAMNLPSGYTADVTGEYRTPTTPTAAFSDVVNEYSNRIAITSGFDGCPGTCTAIVPGVGFRVSCDADTNTTWTSDDYMQTRRQLQFYSQTDWVATGGITVDGSPEFLSIKAGWSINNVDPFVVVHRSCNLSLALVSYPLRIENRTTTLDLPIGTNPDVLGDLPTARTPPNNSLTGPTTLGGFRLLGNMGFGDVPTQGPFYANVSMVVNGAHGIYSLYGLNAFTWSHAINPNWDVSQFAGYVWRDPIEDVLAAYHEIMFRLALKAAVDPSLVDPIIFNGTTYTSVRPTTASYTLSENYYHTRFEYLGAAVIVILLGILSVTPTFRGWWRIGRPTTLSPLETAKAFQAPLLAESNSNDTITDLVKRAKNTNVMYGVGIVGENGEPKTLLQMGRIGTVNYPRSKTFLQR
ncbi:hypothetical protein BP6252_11931 [Coleophoma cylindrospora]|uniref:Uncharacterized protein n=1 Tax=Coleophoma cylindrospora TaxID=1849047 RepID=A0A3D8QFT3_9HELO|nr:hypothetical protein BP6252_11931 [Coleophoma cylindrospora]